MQPEEREILDRTLALSEENNKILRKMQRSLRWGRFFNALYWVFIIGTAVGAYYYVQPYLDPLWAILGGFKGKVPNFDSLLKSGK